MRPSDGTRPLKIIIIVGSRDDKTHDGMIRD